MEKEELQARWPLFKVEEIEPGKFKIIDHSSSYVINKETFEKAQVRIDQDHASWEKVYALRPLYPNLYISPLGVWIKVNDKDRENLFIKKIETYEKSDYAKLASLNETYKIISERPDEFFLCGQCQEVCLMKIEKPQIDKLLDNNTKHYKFRSAGASIFCNVCVESPGYAQKEYAAAKKLGSLYYD